MASKYAPTNLVVKKVPGFCTQEMTFPTRVQMKRGRTSKWWRCPGLNGGPAAYESAALPTELHRHAPQQAVEYITVIQPETNHSGCVLHGTFSCRWQKVMTSWISNFREVTLVRPSCHISVKSFLRDADKGRG